MYFLNHFQNFFYCDRIMVISTSTLSSLNFSNSSILFFIIVFVSSTRLIGVSLILFEMTVDVTSATSVHISPIAASITTVAIAFPLTVTG